ncbi:hypothetical protein DFQ28_003716 [Apophysomyces sp. BC1034]|nr:hypothetical protein DFQ30_003718 [Apophysomyces sp. BC1015]KAG0178898.1 hypothetical protein DFQ29_002853 [Apophysomyces sp. BC1021]KAG0189223.1 hypothetical protein DFQ28_003716 [Apophysomyces sp. BC1034]
MSCKTCGGCFTGSGCTTSRSSKTKNELTVARILGLLQLAAQTNDQTSNDHDHVIPTIVAELSQNIYASQMALLSAYNQLSLTDFLELAECCCMHDMTGVHIAWALEHCHSSPEELMVVLREEEKCKELWHHLDGQAEVHEVFNNLAEGAVGRIKRTPI